MTFKTFTGFSKNKYTDSALLTFLDNKLLSSVRDCAVRLVLSLSPYSLAELSEVLLSSEVYTI